MGIIQALKDNPRYALMRGVARFQAVRSGVAGVKGLMAAGHHRRDSARLISQMPSSLFPDVAPDKFLAEVRERGCAFGLKLPPDLLAQILDYAGRHPVYAYREEHQGFMPDQRALAEEKLGREILLAQYFNSDRDCPAIGRIASDPLLNWIALNYIGSKPRFLGCNLWWTYPVRPNRADQLKHAHFFHRDIDDFRFLKFFFYLTDVERGDGGHWIVLGSHRKHPFLKPKDYFLLRRYEDAEINEFYGKDVLEITGEAGIGFAEDTLCVHKAASPVRRPRLILQLQYAMFDLGVGRDDRDPSQLRMLDGLPAQPAL